MANSTNSVNIPVNQQASIIIGYFQLLIGVIGEVGNVLAIILFSRHSLRKYSYSFYCLVLAFTDIAYLLQTFVSWSAYNLNADLTTAAAFLCPLTAFIPYYFGTLSTFLLTMIAVDRTLTIVYPRKFLIFKKRWFQIVIVVILAVIDLLINILVPLKYRIAELKLGNSSLTIRNCQMPPDFLAIQMWNTIFIFILLNVIINNYLNIKTILFIRASRRRVAGNNGRTSSSSVRDRKFAICSICLNLAAMLFKLPFFISVLVLTYSNLNLGGLLLVLRITNTISFMDNGFSFCINMFVNSVFYNEFLRLFGLRKLSLNSSNSSVTNTSFSLKTLAIQRSNKKLILLIFFKICLLLNVHLVFKCIKINKKNW